MKYPPLILDLDDSVVSPPYAYRIKPDEHWREKIRFGCTKKQFQDFWTEIKNQLLHADQLGTVMMGSGDFHHLSFGLIQHYFKTKAMTSPVRLIVLDNHPDNMRFPWGIHCGSWVRHVAKLPQISHIHVVGITSKDIGTQHAWENYLTPIIRNKLTYWSVGVDVNWAKWLGLGHAFKSFEHHTELCETFCDFIQKQPEPTYLSIDKDVFSESVVLTNWDQGHFTEIEVQRIIAQCKGSLIGSDITGEVSEWLYNTKWKQWLSAVDNQQLAFGKTLSTLHDEHSALNQRLLKSLDRSRY